MNAVMREYVRRHDRITSSLDGAKQAFEDGKDDETLEHLAEAATGLESLTLFASNPSGDADEDELGDEESSEDEDE